VIFLNLALGQPHSFGDFPAPLLINEVYPLEVLRRELSITIYSIPKTSPDDADSHLGSHT